jgi:cytochrome c-type biogenesis protein CcmH
MMRIWLIIGLFLLAYPVIAIDSNPQPFADAMTEARYKELLKELRCMVCPNQPLSDSEAGLAQDLREEVREMVSQGQSNVEIKTFLVARYGDSVLYNPPVMPKTFLLWFGPAVLLLIAFFVLVYFIRRQNKAVSTPVLTTEEQEKLTQVLNQRDPS